MEKKHYCLGNKNFILIEEHDSFKLMLNEGNNKAFLIFPKERNKAVVAFENYLEEKHGWEVLDFYKGYTDSDKMLELLTETMALEEKIRESEEENPTLIEGILIQNLILGLNKLDWNIEFYDGIPYELYKAYLVFKEAYAREKK